MTLILETSSSSQFVPSPPRQRTAQDGLVISYTVFADDKEYRHLLLEVPSTDCTITITGIDDSDVPQTEFQRQKQAFLNIRQTRPLFLSPYQGQFVVSHNGEILDSDSDLATLTGRFFHRNPGLSVYITKVGSAVRHVFATPPER